MALRKYRVNIVNGAITDCIRVTKESSLPDYLYIKQYGSFPVLHPKTHELLAYLLKAENAVDARLRAEDKLLARQAKANHKENRF